MLHKISLYYFSPTGGTKKAGETFCQEMAGKVEVIDLGVPKQTVREPEREVVVFAAPVFGGRIPKLVTDKEASWKRETGGDSGSVRNPCL